MKRLSGLKTGLLFMISTVLVMALSMPAGADSLSPKITLNGDDEAPEVGIIKARVEDDTAVSGVTLYLRKPGEVTYTPVDMKRNKKDVYFYKLEKELGMAKDVEYYLVAQDTSGNQSTLPGFSPAENPMTATAEGSSISADEIVLASPDPGVTYDTGDQLVMVTFYRTGRQVDLNTVRLRIDKVDRTQEADLIGNTLMWEPRRPLTDGVHEIEVIAKDMNGDPVGPNIWTFGVKTRVALPLGAEGDVYVGLQRNDRSNNAAQVPLWNNRVDLGARGQTGFLNWRAGVMLTSEETSFLTSESIPDRQPVNRYYLEGRSRHWKVRLGDSHPTFSDLSLKGVLVRGADVEFKSNRFNANFVYGFNKRELNEDIHIIGSGYTQIGIDTFLSDEGDTVYTSSSNLMALQDQTSGTWNIYQFSPGTPQRDVIALKMAVTPVRNRWATWDLGFNFFGAEDDTTSLDYRYDPDNQTRYFAYRDSSFFTDYKPKKNWVGTFQSTLRFNDNKSELSAEFGGTMVTENMFSYISDDIRDDLPDTINEDTFLINGSTQTSFDKLKLKESVGDGVSDAIMSVYRFKFASEVPIPKTRTRVRAEAYKTPTHYVSLGNPQIRTDVAGYKFDVRTRFLQDQVALTAGYNSYSDNLNGERKQYSNAALDQKDLTKDTSVANFSVSLMPKIYKKYSPTVTVGIRNYNASNDLDLNVAQNDTLNMVDTSTNSLMLSFGGVLPVGLQRHAGMVTITNMGITDDRPLQDYDLNESDNMTVMFNLNSQLNPMPVILNTSIGHTSNKSYRKTGNLASGYDRDEIATGIMMLNFAGTYKWFRDKRLKTTAGISYIGSSNDEAGVYEIDNSKVSFKIEADYRLTSVTSVGALVRFINYTDNTNSINDYDEPIFGMTLRSAF